MMLNSTKIQFDSSLNDLGVRSKSQGYGKAKLCSHSVVKLHEAAQMFVIFDYIRRVGRGGGGEAVKTSCK